MDKKGIELSMNVIIIAALGLLVLVVLSVVFLGRAGVFSKSTADCVIQGGTCMDASTKCINQNNAQMIQSATLSCPALPDGTVQICCLPVSK